MNRPIAPLLSLCLLALAVAPPAHADDAAVRAELETQYQQLAQAMEQKDVIGLEGLLSPDYSSTDASGATRNCDQSIRFWKQRLAPLPEIACRCEIDSVESSDAEAVVTVRISFRAAGADGQTWRLAWTAIDRDTWRKSCDGWRLARTECLSTDQLDSRKQASTVPTASTLLPRRPSR